MDNIIVVFGSVKSKTYDHLRLAMMSAGILPSVVRIDRDSQHRSTEQLTSASNQFHFEHPENLEDFDPEETTDHMYGEIDARIDPVLAAAFGNRKLEDVVGVVFPEGSDMTLDWAYFMAKFDPRIAAYQAVTDPETGDSYLDGEGFGRTLPLSRIM